MRNNILPRKEVLNVIGLNASDESLISSVGQLDVYRYVIDWANGAANDVEVQVHSSDYEDFLNPATGLEDFVNLDFGATVKADTASGRHVFDVELIASKFTRLALIVNAGALDVIATIRGASQGA